jgi:hypothetical protein
MKKFWTGNWLPIGVLLERRHKISPQDRMRFLIYCANRGGFIPQEQLRAQRIQFEMVREVLCPLAGNPCYVCRKKASDRHHILPLCKGGLNNSSNLVPLCFSCHQTVTKATHIHNKPVIDKYTGMPVSFGWEPSQFKSIAKGRTRYSGPVKSALSSTSDVVYAPVETK